MKYLVKTIVFLVVSVITWSLITPLMAQYRAKAPKRASETQVQLQPVTTVTGSFGPKKPNVELELGKSGGISESHVRLTEIKVDGATATVRMHVSLYDVRPGITYVWRLRVVDAEMQPLAGRVYDDQIFGLDLNGKKEADFSDSVTLPASAKRIELSLYEIPAGWDLSFLNDAKLMVGRAVACEVKLLN